MVEDDSRSDPFSAPVPDLSFADAVPGDPPRPSRLSVAVLDAESLAPVFFTALFLAVILALGYVLSSFLADAVISCILLGLFQKPYREILRRVKNRWVASGLATTAIVLVLVLPVFGFLYALTVEANAVFERLEFLFGDGGRGLVDHTIGLADRHGLHITPAVISEYVGRLAKGMNDFVLAMGSELFGNILAFTIHGAVQVVMIFYLFADGDRLRDFLFRLSPLPDHEDALLVETFQKVSRGLVVGNGLGSAIQGALGGIAMWLAGLQSPLLWGSVMAILAFLPLVGITIVVFPATFVLLMRGETATAIAFFTFCMIMGTIVENIVKTRLMGSAMRMHDLLVFLSIIGGMAAFGVIGFVYGPLIAMLFITLHGLYESHYLPHIARNFGRTRGTIRPTIVGHTR